jgi:ABC-2 type transport system permease protein
VFAAVFGTGLYITVVGLLGMALGSVMRNTAAVISTLFGVMVVLPVLVGSLPSAWTEHVAPYRPSNAGQAIMNVQPIAGFLAPWTGLAVFAGYLMAVVAAAAVLLKRRDA